MARLGLFLTIALTVVTLVFAGLMGQPGPLQAEADLNGFSVHCLRSILQLQSLILLSSQALKTRPCANI